MSFESFESMEVKPEAVQEAADAKLGAFQNPSFNEMMETMGHDLMPKIRFTTDKAEAEEAAKADRSNPFDLPTTFFMWSPKRTPVRNSQKAFFPGDTFQNPSYGIEVHASCTDRGNGRLRRIRRPQS